MQTPTTVCIALLLLCSVVAPAVAHGKAHKPRRLKPLPIIVTERHLAGLNSCDLPQLFALRTHDFHFFFPSGPPAVGKPRAKEIFRTICKPYRLGGLRGISFKETSVFLVGNTYNVKWVASAPFMKDYEGADAYVTRGRKMAAQVTTFDESEITFLWKRD